MKTRITTIEELKQLFVESLLNHTSAVTKVSDHSVLNGISYGVAKVGQKALKDIVLVEKNVNPDMAYGIYLDQIAANWGIAARFGAGPSTTYIRVVGDSGTFYQAGVNTVSSDQGIVFDLATNFTIDADGFGYIKVQSQTDGLETKVKPFSLNSISPVPSGHTYLINEYIATGGRDAEEDEYFRTRIKEGANIIASQTLSKLEQVLMRENNLVLKVFRGGVDSIGNTIVKIATQNGSTLSASNLASLLTAAAPYFALSDNRVYEGIQTYGVVFENIDYEEIDIEFNVKIKDSYDSDSVRIDMQVAISKFFDYRFYKNTGIIEWDDLFLIIKQTAGVEYISDSSFRPNQDIIISKSSLPRVKSFLMYDLDGNIISDSNDLLSPIYYPNNIDLTTQSTI